ncbi:hypothetical protein D3C83_19070 [compost metagenome]
MGAFPHLERRMPPEHGQRRQHGARREGRSGHPGVERIPGFLGGLADESRGVPRAEGPGAFRGLRGRAGRDIGFPPAGRTVVRPHLDHDGLEFRVGAEGHAVRLDERQHELPYLYFPDLHRGDSVDGLSCVSYG